MDQRGLIELTVLIILLATLPLAEGSCRNLKIKEIGKDKALVNHTIRTIQPISDFDTCIRECFLDSRCFTFNLCTKRDGALTCNLLNSDHIRSRKELVERSGCTYYGSENACSSSPCSKNATCQGDFDHDPVPYKCICPAGYTGQSCHVDIDECKSGAHDCHKNASCTNTEDGYNCTCKDGYHGDGKTCQGIDKCKLRENRCHVNATCHSTIGRYKCICNAGLYGNGTECRVPETCEELNSTLTDERKRTWLHTLKPKGVGYSVFCSFSNFSGCGLGTWNLALKINGNLTTFLFDSKLWKNQNLFNPKASLTGLDDTETKSSAYWNIPLTKLCLGMKYGGVIRWISININANSLKSVMVRKAEKRTHLGEQKWRSLLPPGIASLQTKCKMEGFNLDGSNEKYGLKRRLRLGYFTDDLKCIGYQAHIGLGSRIDNQNKNNWGLSCGNYGTLNSNNGKKIIRAFCYILVQ